MPLTGGLKALVGTELRGIVFPFQAATIIPGFGIAQSTTKIRLRPVNTSTPPLWWRPRVMLVSLLCLFAGSKSRGCWFTGYRHKNHLPGLVFL